MGRKVVAACAAIGLIASMGSGASAAQRPRDERTRPSYRELLVKDAQHGDVSGHLPASSRNMKLINKVKLTDVPGGVADVNYRAGFAYLSKWATTCSNRQGTGAGIEVVNVRKPRQARRAAFIKAGPNAYQTEGVHALRLNTPRFKGNVIVFSNEPCDSSQPGGGGFSIYDVRKPWNPRKLVDQFGDTDVLGEGSPNAYHSVFAWNAGNKAYAVAVDNYEFEDVDIFDITNPRMPVLIRETGADDWPESVWDNLAKGEEVFHHDVWVKKVRGQWQMLLSYWDLGYVLLNVDDPANPQFIGKTQWDAADPQMLQFTPEGNAHHATWSTNKKFILAADEDFAPYRTSFAITSGDNAGQYPAEEFGWTPQIGHRDGKSIAGVTVYGGLGCPSNEEYGEQPAVPDASTITAPEGQLKIAVLLRGLCFFSEKVESAQNAGYDAVIVANSHAGSGDGALPDAVLCGSMGHNFTPEIPGICIGHRAFHLLFGQEPTYEGEDAPALGTVGATVSASAVFDGWGYIHLFDSATLERIQTYAVTESLMEEHANVFPLSVHENKTDPRWGKNLSYSSYYQAGARVLKFGRTGIQERGHFIDEGGNDFWGVYPIKRGKKRPLLLFSDRDFGLYILKYTGPQ